MRLVPPLARLPTADCCGAGNSATRRELPGLSFNCWSDRSRYLGDGGERATARALVALAEDTWDGEVTAFALTANLFDAVRKHGYPPPWLRTPSLGMARGVAANISSRSHPTELLRP